MKYWLATLATVATSGAAQQSTARTPVLIHWVGDDGLSQRLLYTLEQAIKVDGKLRLASMTDKTPIIVESDTNVIPDRLGRKEVAIFSVMIYRSSDQKLPIVGVCFENDLPKCARQILRVIRIRA